MQASISLLQTAYKTLPEPPCAHGTSGCLAVNPDYQSRALPIQTTPAFLHYKQPVDALLVKPSGYRRHPAQYT